MIYILIQEKQEGETLTMVNLTVTPDVAKVILKSVSDQLGPPDDDNEDWALPGQPGRPE